MNRRAAVVCSVWVFSLRAVMGAAQQGPDPAAPRVEVWGGASGVIAGPSADTRSAYSPPLLSDGPFTSHGGQTLAADARRALGVSGGVNIYPRNWFGLQVLVERARCEVSGVNAPYTLDLQYVTRPPPSDVPVTVTVDQSIAWPATSGSLTEWAFAVNAVARIGAPDRVSMILSAGPAYYRLKGEVQPVGFTTFQLGGHSVLFQSDYRLAASVRPAHALGFDTGAEVDAPVGRHAAIIAGFRYLGSRDVDSVVLPTKILNTSELIQIQSLADVAARLGPVRTQLAMSGSRVFVGLKFRR